MALYYPFFHYPFLFKLRNCCSRCHGVVGRGYKAGSHQKVLRPPTLKTSTSRSIICDEVHNLKTVHYTVLLLPTSKGFGLVRHGFSKIFFFYGKNHLHFPYPFYKSKEMFCLEMRTFYFYTATPEELVLLASNKKPVIKPSLKKKKRWGFSWCKNTVTSKITFNWKLISRSKFQTKSRKFSFNHRFTVILMPSTVNYENKIKHFNLNLLMLKFWFGFPYQK